MKEPLSVQMLSHFIDLEVTVSTSIGPVKGTLRKADSSQHQGIGNLLIETVGSWLLIKAWVNIKRRG
jgi:hypothetical protein